MTREEASSIEQISEETRAPPTDETPRGAFFSARGESSANARELPPEGDESTERPPSADDALDEGSEPSPDASSHPKDGGSALASDSGSGSGERPPPPPAPLKPVKSTSQRRPIKVRRILVECALCGYHVAVPPELFGKTVHCPECRADMMFSESSLEPVKDEIIGRIALEHGERRALEHAVPGPIPSPQAVARSHRRRTILIVVLFGSLLAAIGVVGWKLLTRPAQSTH
jgi:hypothetical protein